MRKPDDTGVLVMYYSLRHKQIAARAGAAATAYSNAAPSMAFILASILFHLIIITKFRLYQRSLNYYIGLAQAAANPITAYTASVVNSILIFKLFSFTSLKFHYLIMQNSLHKHFCTV